MCLWQELTLHLPTLLMVRKMFGDSEKSLRGTSRCDGPTRGVMSQGGIHGVGPTAGTSGPDARATLSTILNQPRPPANHAGCPLCGEDLTAPPLIEQLTVAQARQAIDFALGDNQHSVGYAQNIRRGDIAPG